MTQNYHLIYLKYKVHLSLFCITLNDTQLSADLFKIQSPPATFLFDENVPAVSVARIKFHVLKV
jgi:hypothetical protein